MEFKKIDIDNIKYMYRAKNENIKDIANLYNVDRRRISKICEGILHLYEDEEWLYQKYCIENIPKTQICKLANCSESSIRKYTKKFEFETNQISYRKRKYNYIDNFFETIDTEEKAYWLGFIIADGCITYNPGRDRNKKTSEIRLTINLAAIDESHLQKFASQICPDAEIKDRVTHLDATNKDYQIKSLRLYNKKIVEDLMMLGVLPNKSLKEIYPNIDAKYNKHFIRGLFDGDGCFSYWNTTRGNYLNSQMSIISSKKMIEKLASILSNELGIYCGITNNTKNKDLYRITITNSNSIKVMNWLYEDSNIYLDRKYNKFQVFLNLQRYSLISSES